jgi:hypothetical protein
LNQINFERHTPAERLYKCTARLHAMESCYVTFKDEDNDANELFRVYPDELRRQYQPESTDRTMTVHNRAVQVMKMAYQMTDCIVHLRTKDGPVCLSDAISVILEEYDIVKATFMPCNVTIDVTVNDTEKLKKMVYFFYPSITNTNKYGIHDLIEIDPNTMIRTRPQSCQRRRIPHVPAIPVG